MAAGVLLVLRAEHTGIVGHSHHKTSVNADVRGSVKGICGDIESHVLHCAKGALTGEGSADGHLAGYLFVGRPFGVYFVIFCGLLGYLGAGGSGIA